MFRERPLRVKLPTGAALNTGRVQRLKELQVQVAILEVLLAVALRHRVNVSYVHYLRLRHHVQHGLTHGVLQL